jgi:hypothetical protein
VDEGCLPGAIFSLSSKTLIGYGKKRVIVINVMILFSPLIFCQTTPYSEISDLTENGANTLVANFTKLFWHDLRCYLPLVLSFDRGYSAKGRNLCQKSFMKLTPVANIIKLF